MRDGRAVRPCTGLSGAVSLATAATRSGEEMPMAGPAGFTGKAALITGGSGGIGLRVAEQLAEAGAHVFINGRSAERGEQAAARLHEISQDVRFIAGDCASYQDVAAVVETARSPARQLPSPPLAVLMITERAASCPADMTLRPSGAGSAPREPGTDPGQDLRHDVVRADVDSPLGILRRLEERDVQPHLGLGDAGPRPRVRRAALVDYR